MLATFASQTPLQGEVDEVRLRREIPPPVLERLQRELLNSSMPSGPGFTAPSAAPTALGHPSPARRLAQGSGGGSTGGNAGGLLRPADSDSSPSEYPSVGSGGIGSGGVGLSGRGGRGGVAAGAMGRERWIGGGWPQERRGVEEEEFVEEPREFSPGVPRQNPRSRVWTDEVSGIKNRGGAKEKRCDSITGHTLTRKREQDDFSEYRLRGLPYRPRLSEPSHSHGKSK